MSNFLHLIEQAPEVCTLPTVERPLRISQFADLFASATAAASRTSPTRAMVELPSGALESARNLAARETECCSFFTFTTVLDGERAVMTIEVPDQYAEVLTALTSLVGRTES